jgi:hypothetical protein
MTALAHPTGGPDLADREKDKDQERDIPHDAASLISEQTLLAKKEGIKPAFLAKVNVLNAALHEIGMGRYQWELFVTAGFGWFADNICECERAESEREPAGRGRGRGQVQARVRARRARAREGTSTSTRKGREACRV